MEALEPPIVPADDLDRLELQIARRADELSLQAGIRGKDLEHWLQAEHEIMKRCWQPGSRALPRLPQT